MSRKNLGDLVPRSVPSKDLDLCPGRSEVVRKQANYGLADLVVHGRFLDTNNAPFNRLLQNVLRLGKLTT
jgi:hypothetical protein